jgi:2-iminobutanoate/2-iminopropanoate deaminase
MNDMTYITTPYSYSSAVAASNLVFLGLHRGSGDAFEEQLRSTLARMQTTLEQLGMTLADVAKVHVWLKEISDLPAMEKIFFDYFEKDRFPARMTATTQFIDDDCLVMVDGMAVAQSDEPVA